MLAAVEAPDDRTVVFRFKQPYAPLLYQLDATEADTQLYGRLASSILYANPALRARVEPVLRTALDTHVRESMSLGVRPRH